MLSTSVYLTLKSKAKRGLPRLYTDKSPHASPDPLGYLIPEVPRDIRVNSNGLKAELGPELTVMKVLQFRGTVQQPELF